MRGRFAGKGLSRRALGEVEDTVERAGLDPLGIVLGFFRILRNAPALVLDERELLVGALERRRFCRDVVASGR